MSLNVALLGVVCFGLGAASTLIWRQGGVRTRGTGEEAYGIIDTVGQTTIKVPPPPPFARRDAPRSVWETVPGGGISIGDDTVFASRVVVERADWSDLVEDTADGVAGLVIRQTDAHERHLARGGFQPLEHGLGVSPSPSDTDLEQVDVTDLRLGTLRCPRNPEWLVHRRLFYAAGTGAFVVARTQYERSTGIATVELAYVEATIRGARYQDVSVTYGPVRR